MILFFFLLYEKHKSPLCSPSVDKKGEGIPQINNPDQFEN